MPGAKFARIISFAAKATPCPSCSRKLDAFTAALFDDDKFGERPPTKGNVTMCAYCGAFLIFADDAGALRVMTEEERDSVTFSPIVSRIYADLRAKASEQPDFTKINPGRRN